MLLIFSRAFFAFLITIFGFFIMEAKSAESYLCTKSDNVNFRNGPGVKFSIVAKVFKKGYPLRVLETIENWHAVIDFKGDKMWVSSVNLKSKCGAIIKSEGEPASVFFQPNIYSVELLTLDDGFIIENIECFTKWCKVRIENTSGWIERSKVWGV